MPEKVMNAATLVSLRERANQGPDGDRVFLVGCQLGFNGDAVRDAFAQATREVDAELKPGEMRNGHRHDTRVADRLIELVNGAEAQEPPTESAPDPDHEFHVWMAHVNQLAIARLGVSAEDLPDQLWRDMFDDEVSPSDALATALENEGISL
jgi:hypothetical protein